MKVKIIVDATEWNNCDVAAELKKLDAELEKKKLQVGDFILSDRVCIERKTTKDFLQSLIDGRLFEQVKNLVANFEKPAIIVEGNGDIYSERMVHPNAIRGAISALAIDFRIPIIQTTCEHETALFLYMIASREQLDKKTSISLHGKKKPMNDALMMEYIVSSFPGVGKGTAQNILTYFKTISNFVNAEAKELKKVEKIGKKKAEKIRHLLDKEYS